MNRAIFNRLFLPSAHSLRSFAMLRRSILTAVHADLHILRVLLYMRLLSLPIIVSGLIGDGKSVT